MLEYIGTIIVFTLIIVVFFVYNNLQKSRNNIRNINSNLIVYFQERWSLIPVILEIVKNYEIYDASIIEKLTKIRNENYISLSFDKKFEIDGKISKVISKMIDIGDGFDKLNTNEAYLNFKKHFETLEKEIKETKKAYKEYSKKYNEKIQKFPINIIAILFGFNEEIIK